MKLGVWHGVPHACGFKTRFHPASRDLGVFLFFLITFFLWGPVIDLIVLRVLFFLSCLFFLCPSIVCESLRCGEAFWLRCAYRLADQWSRFFSDLMAWPMVLSMDLVDGKWWFDGWAGWDWTGQDRFSFIFQFIFSAYVHRYGIFLLKLLKIAERYCHTRTTATCLVSPMWVPIVPAQQSTSATMNSRLERRWTQLSIETSECPAIWRGSLRRFMWEVSLDSDIPLVRRPWSVKSVNVIINGGNCDHNRKSWKLWSWSVNGGTPTSKMSTRRDWWTIWWNTSYVNELFVWWTWLVQWHCMDCWWLMFRYFFSFAQFSASRAIFPSFLFLICWSPACRSCVHSF